MYKSKTTLTLYSVHVNPKQMNNLNKRPYTLKWVEENLINTCYYVGRGKDTLYSDGTLREGGFGGTALLKKVHY